MSLPNKNVADIKNVESEAGVIATLCYHPEFSFYSEQLKPNHFSDEQNAYFYYGICELAKRGVETIDAYNLFNILNANAATRKAVENISIQSITDMLSVSKCIDRSKGRGYPGLPRRSGHKPVEHCNQYSLSETMSYKDPLKCWNTVKPIHHNVEMKQTQA